jgi:hypothetical protein
VSVCCFFDEPLTNKEDLDCFYLVTKVHNAARNLVYSYLLKTLLSVLSGVFPEMELLSHMVIILLILVYLFFSFSSPSTWA